MRREAVDFSRDFRPATEREREAQIEATARVHASRVVEGQPVAPDAPAADPEGRAVSDAPMVELVLGSTIKPEAIRWLWDGWIAAGKLHVMAGPSGTGKTTLALGIAATITNAGRWPDGTRAAAGDVVVWSGEDGIADTLVARLTVNDADMRRVRLVRGVKEAGGDRSFDPATDTPALELALARMESRPVLLIVDPIVSAVAGDSHKNTETRRSLQPLVDLGERIGCAILGISHFSKGSAGRDPVERVTGSLAFGALARIVLAVVKTTDDEGKPGPRLLARAKSNLGPDGGGFHFELDQFELADAPNIRASRVLWGDAVEGEARALLASAEADADPDERAQEDDAKTWLVATLTDAGGSLGLSEVKAAARQTGIPLRSIYRARLKAGIGTKTTGFGKTRASIWTLPNCDPAPCIAADPPISAITANPETLAPMAVMAECATYGDT